jgi:hypothetical protein
MASLDQLIQYTQQFQDMELTTALQQLRQDPQALQRFLQNAQDSLYKDVTTQKDGAFQKIYGDLQRATSADEAYVLYQQRNGELNRLQKEVYDSRKQVAEAVVFDRDLAKRQVELNQWSAGNKMDTLFVYQQLFLILCCGCILTFLWFRGIIGTMFYAALGLTLAAIFTFTVVERAQFTQFLRDNRYWNRRKFPTYQGPSIPSVCGVNVGDISSQLQQEMQSVESTAAGDYQSAMQQASTAVQQGAQQAAAAVQQGAQQAAATNPFANL